MTRLLPVLLLILSGCMNRSPNLSIREIQYSPLLTVGTINDVVYSDVILTNYLTYSVFRSQYKDGYLYQKYITILSKSSSSDISIYIEGDTECGTKLSDVTKEHIDNESYNRYQYHITCTPKIVIVDDNGKKYHYTW